MTAAELDDLVAKHGGDVVACVFTLLEKDLSIEQITIMFVHRSFRGYDEIRSWASVVGLRDLGPDGFVFGMSRKDARVAVTVSGMKPVAQALEDEESAQGFTLAVFHDNDALIRHIELERVTLTRRPVPMVKGGDA